MPNTTTRLLTIGQAAARLGVHVNTLRGWVDRGLVPAVKLPSGYRRFTVEQIEQIERDMMTGASSVESQERP